MDTDPLPAAWPFSPIAAVITAALPDFTVAQIVALAVAVVCFFISAFVSGSEIAYFSLTPQQLRELDDDDEKNSQAVSRIMSKPEKLLATILIANNLVNVAIVVLLAFALDPLFVGLTPVWSFVVQTILLTFLILLVGEILPKLYANNDPLRWSKRAAPLLSTFITMLSPISRLLVRSTSIVKRVVSKQADNITTDDLSQALEITSGTTDDDKDMLEGILKFGDTTASEIMTPRINITDIDIESTFDEVLKIVVDSGYSRLPVYEETQDNIRGILYARDLLPYIGHPIGEFRWQSLLRDPYYVPESRMIDDLLEDFRRLKIHLAIVVDEYGGTQGIVTMEDVLEEIVGDIDDEYDQPDIPYKRLADDTYVFEGRTLLTDFFRVTGLDEADYDDVTENAETLAGMLLAIKGDFPKAKEPLVYGCCRFLVLGIDQHRITDVRVKVMPELQPDATISEE